jgi:hypothetical protein
MKVSKENMSEERWRKMYGIVHSRAGGDYEVVEVEAAPAEVGWLVRSRRGSGIHMDGVKADKLHATREAAEARRAELQQALDALKDTVPPP